MKAVLFVLFFASTAIADLSYNVESGVSSSVETKNTFDGGNPVIFVNDVAYEEKSSSTNLFLKFGLNVAINETASSDIGLIYLKSSSASVASLLLGGAIQVGEKSFISAGANYTKLLEITKKYTGSYKDSPEFGFQVGFRYEIYEKMSIAYSYNQFNFKNSIDGSKIFNERIKLDSHLLGIRLDF